MTHHLASIIVSTVLISSAMPNESNAAAEELTGRIERVTTSATSNISQILDDLGCYPTMPRIDGVPYAEHVGYTASVSSRVPIVLTKNLCKAEGLTPSIYVSFVSASSDLDAKLVSPSGVEYRLWSRPYRDGTAYSFTIKPKVESPSISEAASTETGAWKLVVAGARPAKLARFYAFTDSSW